MEGENNWIPLKLWNVAQMNLQRILIRELMFYLLESGNNTSEVTKHICCTKGDGAVDYNKIIFIAVFDQTGFETRFFFIVGILKKVEVDYEHRLVLCLTMLILFTKPSAQAGYDTRSTFKRSLIGLNSEFSFS